MTEQVARVVIDRILASGGTQRLRALLVHVKSSSTVKRSAFRTSGSKDDIATAAQEAHRLGHVSLTRLASLADECEENGSQRIVIFTATDTGRTKLSAASLAPLLEQKPREPTVALYGGLPRQTRLYAEVRDSTTILKRIGPAHTWNRDQNRSYETSTEKATFWTREDGRAVDMLRFDVASGRTEIRIDRVFSGTSKTFLDERFLSFLEALSNNVRVPDDLKPVPLWLGFSDIVSCRDDTYMSVDSAYDPSIEHTLSRRRAGTKAPDIRDDKRYDMNAKSYGRSSVSIYWKLPEEEPSQHPRYLYTHLARATVHLSNSRSIDVCKVWIPRRASPQEVNHVLARLSTIAGPAIARSS